LFKITRYFWFGVIIFDDFAVFDRILNLIEKLKSLYHLNTQAYLDPVLDGLLLLD
jgi:hypothetical protein